MNAVGLEGLSEFLVGLDALSSLRFFFFFFFFPSPEFYETSRSKLTVLRSLLPPEYKVWSKDETDTFVYIPVRCRLDDLGGRLDDFGGFNIAEISFNSFIFILIL